jgi:antirestriction protein ArdC
MDKQRRETEWAKLLNQALTEPGVISEAYSAFHGYSIGNQLLALIQCRARGIQPGPIATFPRWKERGRLVRKGERALTLVMPVTRRHAERDRGTGEERERTFTLFVERRNWFVLSQTDGEPYTPPQSAREWDRALALERLGISEEPFTLMNGNVQGFARDKSIAVSPVAAMPWKTLAHEMAHVVLGHTSEGTLSDGDDTPRDVREVEAESVAYLVCTALGLPGAAESRGYIQSWARGQAISERSAQRIFAAADKILRAWQPRGVSE